jgi:uncharacterized protein YPO0396
MEDRVLTHLLSKVSERIEQLTESLADGNAKDFAEYRYLCGTIRGLSHAQSEMKDLVRRLREIDNE